MFDQIRKVIMIMILIVIQFVPGRILKMIQKSESQENHLW